MKNTLKRVLALLLTIVMTVGIAPLSGFVGLELPKFGLPEWFEFNLVSFATDHECVPGEPELVWEEPATYDREGYQYWEVYCAECGEYYNGYEVIVPALEPPSREEIESVNFTYDLSYYWNEQNEKVRYAIITGCDNPFYDIVIPDSIDGYPVLAIGNEAFYFCSYLETVVIPENVTAIGDQAFWACGRLKSIEIPEKVTSIGEMAFEYCDALTSVVVPDSVTKMGMWAFSDCENLESIVFGDGVTVISARILEGCNNLKSVTLPASVTAFGLNAFGGCGSLENVYYEGDIASWCAINFVNDFDEHMMNPLSYADNFYVQGELQNDIVIPDIVKTINSHAFFCFEGIESIVIPEGVETIGSYAFQSCTNLESVVIPDSVTTLGGYSFIYSGIKSVVIGDGLKEICGFTFQECRNLEKVTIGSSIEKIGVQAFALCNNITDVYYNGDLESWCNITFNANGTYLDPSSNPMYYGKNFYLNDKLFENLIIPSSITEIKNYSFIDFNCLKSVVIPDHVTKIGSLSFSFCVNAKSLKIGSGIISIPNRAFEEWRSLETVSIGCNVSSIGATAFKNCLSLKSIEIPDNVTSIGASVFSGCTGLGSVTIGNGVTSIPGSAFSGCKALECVHISNSVKTIDNAAFQGCTSLKSFIISDNVAKMGSDVFSGCTALAEVKIGSGVTSIASGAFNGCSGLVSIIIPNSVTNIGSLAFRNCSNLTDVYYAGTEDEWNKITISSNNNSLKNATIHYESTGEGKELEISDLKLLRGTASMKSYKGTDYVAITMAEGRTMTGLYKDMADGGTVELVDICGTIQSRDNDYVAYQSQNKTNPVATMKVTYADGTTISYPVVFELYEMEREIDLDISKNIRPIRGKASKAEDAKGEYILIEMLEGQSSVGVYKATTDGSTTVTLDGAEGMFTEQEKLYIFYGSQNTFNPEGRLTVTTADGTQATYRVVFKMYEMDPYVNVAKGLRPVRGAVTFDADGTIRIKMTSGQKSVGLYKTMANGATFEIKDANGKVTNNPSSIMFYMTNNTANVTATMIFTLPDGTTKEQKIIFDMGLASDPDPLTYLTAVRGTVSYQNDGEDYIEVKANAGSTGVGLNKECLVKYTITDVDGVMTENDTRYYIYKSQNPDGVTANINFLQSDGSYKTYKVKFVF